MRRAIQLALLAEREGNLPVSAVITLDGQVGELKAVLVDQCQTPLTLIGYSWGAWLVYILAARCTEIARKLILVSSGPFEQRYVGVLRERRLSCLSQDEGDEFDSLLSSLSNPDTADRDGLLARLGELCSKSDSYDPLDDEMLDSDRFRFILLENCGHTPWLEHQSREAFYRILRAEL